MFFEECTLNGIHTIGTGVPLKREDIPDGYYCYDIYTPKEYQDAQHTIALRDLSDHANGSVILKEPLDFQGKTELRMENLILYEESPLITLKNFMAQNQEHGQSENEAEQFGMKFQ